VKRLAQAGEGTDVVQEMMKKRGVEPSSVRAAPQEHYDPFAALGAAQAPRQPQLAGMSEEQQASYLEEKLAAHSHQLEQQHHAEGHPLLRGNSSFSAQAKDEYVERMAARTSDDMATLQAAMKIAVKKNDLQEAGQLKRRIEKVLADQASKKKVEVDGAKGGGKKKGSFMQKQLAKIKKVKETNEMARNEEAEVEALEGAQGEYVRFMRDLEKTACHSNGQRGDDFTAISVNAHRAL